MRRWLVIGGLAMVGIVGIAAETDTRLYLYNGTNAGLVITSNVGCLGVEIRGNVGIFGGWDTAECDI